MPSDENPRGWLRTDTADYWRHARMYEPAQAFAHDPELTWLTVGDGTFGLDSIRIRNLGFRNALPTDIGDALLRRAKESGMIDEYAQENAESLSFADESFDLVFCKESYHHFPRPMLALYEMLRVARRAVMLIEPRDFVIDHGPTRSTGPRKILSDLAVWIRDRRRVPHPPLAKEQLYVVSGEAGYEETGNYGYSISSRELEKVALGLDLPALALKGLNDAFIPEGGFSLAEKDNPVFHEMKNAIEVADRKTDGGRSATSMLMAIIFKVPPADEVRAFLDRHSWLIVDLPRNPYLSRSAD